MHPGSIPGEASIARNRLVMPDPVRFWHDVVRLTAPATDRLGHGSRLRPTPDTMVDGQLRTTDVTSAALLDAMLAVPREEFVDAGQARLRLYRRGHGDCAGARRQPAALSHGAVAVRASWCSLPNRALATSCSMSAAAPAIRRRCCRGLRSPSSRWRADPALAEPRRAKSCHAGLRQCGGCARRVRRSGHAAEAPYDVIFVGGSVESAAGSAFCATAGGGRLVAVEGQWKCRQGPPLSRNGTASVTGRSAFNAAIKPLPGFERAYTFQF